MRSLAIFLIMFLFILSGRMCSDKEEVYEEKSSPGQTEGITIDEATANWKKFMVTADKMVAISENNLKSLESKIDDDTKINGNLKWKMLYNKSEQQLKQLKEELECHNDDVIDGIRNSNLLQITSNKDFPPQFLHDIVELNNEIEDVINE
jgi:hypothetical protein